MLFSNALALLRKAHYALEDLPDTISFPKHPAREAGAPVALEQRRHGEFDFSYLAIRTATTPGSVQRSKMAALAMPAAA
jgi:hypothetical protein